MCVLAGWTPSLQLSSEVCLGPPAGSRPALAAAAAGRTAYRDPRTVTVELQPFSAGAGGPRFPRICGHFRGLAALDCPDQERCELPHAPQRVFK